MPEAPALRPDPIDAIERPLVGAIFRLGAPALEMAILNRVGASDFSEQSGCGDLFEMTRQVRLDGRPLTLAALAEDITARGLAKAAGAALEAGSTVALGEVPFLSQRLIREAVYRDGMLSVGEFHAKFTATADTTDDPRELLRVLEQHSWRMAKLARRLRDLLHERI